MDSSENSSGMTTGERVATAFEVLRQDIYAQVPWDPMMRASEPPQLQRVFAASHLLEPVWLAGIPIGEVLGYVDRDWLVADGPEAYAQRVLCVSDMFGMICDSLKWWEMLSPLFASVLLRVSILSVDPRPLIAARDSDRMLAEAYELMDSRRALGRLWWAIHGARLVFGRDTDAVAEFLRMASQDVEAVEYALKPPVDRTKEQPADRGDPEEEDPDDGEGDQWPDYPAFEAEDWLTSHLSGVRPQDLTEWEARFAEATGDSPAAALRRLRAETRSVETLLRTAQRSLLWGGKTPFVSAGCTRRAILGQCLTYSRTCEVPAGVTRRASARAAGSRGRG